MKEHPEGHVSGRDRLRKSMTVAEILETAISFERMARDFYKDLAPRVSKRIRWLVKELAETTDPGPIRDLFAFLADEETQHKAELEKVYYEIVHSGGV